MACPIRAAAGSGWQQVLVAQAFALQIKSGKRSPGVDIPKESGLMAALGITEDQRQELVKSITAIARPIRGKPHSLH